MPHAYWRSGQMEIQQIRISFLQLTQFLESLFYTVSCAHNPRPDPLFLSTLPPHRLPLFYPRTIILIKGHRPPSAKASHLISIMHGHCSQPQTRRPCVCMSHFPTPSSSSSSSSSSLHPHASSNLFLIPPHADANSPPDAYGFLFRFFFFVFLSLCVFYCFVLMSFLFSSCKCNRLPAAERS